VTPFGEFFIGIFKSNVNETSGFPRFGKKQSQIFQTLEKVFEEEKSL